MPSEDYIKVNTSIALEVEENAEKNSNIAMVDFEKVGGKNGKYEALDDDLQKNNREEELTKKDTFMESAIQLVGCFIGLQASYLTWGLIQEKIMTGYYGEGEDAEQFTSSAFLVFGNRFLALFMSIALVYWPYGRDKNKERHVAPFSAYAPSSISNILSSWAQYEALKYISFPTQVISKSSKTVPVMLVGVMVHRKQYPRIEYIEAFILTAGIAMFTFSEKSDPNEDKSDSAYGFFLLAMYLTCDSFTSQWQSKVFNDYKVDQFQMMLGINIWSCLLTGIRLIQSGQGLDSWNFMMRHNDCLWHNIILSIASAVGQLFIFYTIKKFGPIVFTIIMTTRQMLSMVLSCILFSHPIGLISACGAVVCFSAVGHRIRRNYIKGRSK